MARKSKIDLSLAFANATNPQAFQNFVKHNFKITCPIPDCREPEFGFLMDHMEIGYMIDTHIVKHPNVILVDKPIPDNGYLLSLPEDTVGPDGKATNEIQALGLEKRRRVNYNAETDLLTRFDVSFKDAVKSTHRREWEAFADSLRTGNKEASQKVAIDIPGVAHIDYKAYRVMGTCMTSRQIAYYAHMLADQSACVLFEVNNDACALATAHADILLGYRREKECEAADVYASKRRGNSESETHAILDEAIDEVTQIIESGPYADSISRAIESKGAHTVRLNKEYYEAGLLYPDIDGRDVVLMQNVEATTFMGKVPNMGAMSNTIPSPWEQHIANENTVFEEYFPRRQIIAKGSARLAIS